MKHVALVALVLSMSAGAFGAAAPPAHEGFGGIWVLNRDRGDLPGAPTGTDASGQGGGRRGGGFGGRGGRGGGGGEFGGQGGRGGRGRGQQTDPARRQAMTNYLRTSMEASKQLTIVVHDTSVSITDLEGRVLSLKTDNKKIEERAENGLIKLTRKARWDDDALVHQVDFEDGTSIIRRYELSPGGTQLQFSTTIERLWGGRSTPLLRLYERPVEPK